MTPAELRAQMRDVEERAARGDDPLARFAASVGLSPFAARSKPAESAPARELKPAPNAPPASPQRAPAALGRAPDGPARDKPRAKPVRPRAEPVERTVAVGVKLVQEPPKARPKASASPSGDAPEPVTAAPGPGEIQHPVVPSVRREAIERAWNEYNAREWRSYVASHWARPGDTKGVYQETQVRSVRMDRWRYLLGRLTWEDQERQRAKGNPPPAWTDPPTAHVPSARQSLDVIAGRLCSIDTEMDPEKRRQLYADAEKVARMLMMTCHEARVESHPPASAQPIEHVPEQPKGARGRARATKPVKAAKPASDDEDDPDAARAEAAIAAAVDADAVAAKARTQAVDDLPHEERKFFYGEVDRSGMRKFTIMIRSKRDPERAPRTPGHSRGTQWKDALTKDPPEVWAERIRAHLADGEPRTFNRIMVELSGYTADICTGKAPEEGLWQLVRQRLVVLTHEAPILFLKA